MKPTRLVGHISEFVAYTIFGFNIIICKDLTNSHLISPLGLFCIRSAGACFLFWFVSLFMPKEKIEKKDFLLIFAASMVGLFATQMTFLGSISLTTPVDVSIITTTTPVFTMFVAAAVLKEPITLKKAGGVSASFVGVIILILNTVRLENGVSETKPWGIVLMLMNCFLFATYLTVFKRLISRYTVVTFMKWMFLFSMAVSLPFGIGELVSVDYLSMPTNIVGGLLYLILFSTFTAYFLIPVGQKVLRPTVISLYAYLQPLIASIISIYIGMDRVTWQKIVAAALIITGVVLVNKSRAAESTD